MHRLVITASALSLLYGCGGAAPEHTLAEPVAIQAPFDDSDEAARDDGESELLRHLRVLAEDVDALHDGRELFATNCSPCHGHDGEGTIGPNLTDDRCNHPNDLLGIRDTIDLGLPERGMPAWGPILGEDRLNQLTVYVHSIQGRQIQGRDPEGEDCSALLEASRDPAPSSR